MARWPQGALHLPQQLLHQVRRCLSLLQARSMLIKINDKIYSSLSFPSSLLALHERVIWTTPHLSAGGNKRWRSANIRSDLITVRPLWNIAFKRAATIPSFLVVWPCCLKPVTTKTQPASQDMYNSVKMKSCPKNSNKPNLYESKPRPVNGPPNLRGFIGLCTIRPKLKIYFVVNAN